MTRAEAVDDILTILKAAWDPTGYGMAWPNVPNAALPPQPPEPWARTTVQHTESFAAAIGRAFFRRQGILTVEVFTPCGTGYLGGAVDLAGLIRDAFEGQVSPGGVRFRDCAIREVGPDGGFDKTNVDIDFEYEERR